jgi:pimeloyl-ACP methyl ester carboxylesterase
MGKALVNGITIGYEDVGEGDDVLVLVHGHPFNRSMWRPQVDWIASLNRPRARARPRARIERVESFEEVFRSGDKGPAERVTPPNLEHEDEHEHEDDYGVGSWRVIVPDLRGYGESTVVSGKTTLDVFAEDIAALLDQLDIKRVVIGGLSMGGQIVMEFCRQYPERVRGVLLAATLCSAETQEGKQLRAAMVDRLLREGMGPYAEEVLPKMVTPANLAALPKVAEHVRTMMRSTNAIGAAAAIRGRAERPGYEETLARIDVPALVIVGDEDAFTTREDAEQMSGLMRRSELVWMKGVGHMPNLERAGEFNDALGGLLSATRYDK